MAYGGTLQCCMIEVCLFRESEKKGLGGGMNVVFIIFKRFDLTEKVFAEIALVRPERLFVIADGPRSEAERIACEATRKVTDKVDWPCEVRRNYSESNMGCRNRVSSGLDWVFTQVEDAIILEDDCLPDPSFFRFCTEMLERYRDDGRVGHVGANCYSNDPARGGGSYHFSRYAMIWGWATWRRAWKQFDVNLSRWPVLRKGGWENDMLLTREESEYFAAWWDDLCFKNDNAWSGQWIFTCLLNNWLCIQPSVNLVSNIGFRQDGTHTLDADRPYAGVPVCAMEFPLRHPKWLIADRQADFDFARIIFPICRPWWKKAWWKVSNLHWYGALLRKIPLIGTVWRIWRESRAGMGNRFFRD